MESPATHTDAVRQFESDIPFIKPENLYRESARLLEERKLCLSHDEDADCPDLPPTIAERLSPGRRLALERAQEIFRVISQAVNAYPIDKLPAELVVYHRDHDPEQVQGPDQSPLWNAVMQDLSDR